MKEEKKILQQLKIDNDVINHLLFHKSLIDEKDDAVKINHYIDMLQKADEGEHISIEDPFERSIAIAFELVIQQHLNPWDIDLVNFSTIYLKRAKEEKIDLILAGKWKSGSIPEYWDGKAAHRIVSILQNQIDTL